MMMPWELQRCTDDPSGDFGLVKLPDDGGIPQCLLRDKDGLAPFMRINPANSLPVTSQSTLPPWVAKS